MTEARWFANYDEGVPTSLHPYPDRTLIDYLRESATRWPDRPALLFKGATVSYDRLNAESDAFAAALIALVERNQHRKGERDDVERLGFLRLLIRKELVVGDRRRARERNEVL